jgi:hypothetical protein
MVEPLAPSEILSRFVIQTNWYKPSDNCVRYAAFMPNPKNGETSVFRISGISERDIWKIGDREVGVLRNKPVLGRADIGASFIYTKGLKVVPSEPPVRHANIVGWPEEKSEQTLIALQLAAEAIFHKKPIIDPT